MTLFQPTHANGSSNTNGRGQTGDRRGVSLSATVSPVDTETVEYVVPADSTVESLSVRIYSGAELDLRVTPYIDQANDEGRTSLVQLEGKDYIDGNDDLYTWSLSTPVERNDRIVVEAENLDGANAYDFRANVDLDRAGGLSRLWEVFR